MERNFNPRVIGACVVGFALVVGAYVLSNFGESNFQNQTASVAASQPRVAIEVTDNNNNGIEDWRDEFVTTAPIIVNQPPSTYEIPTTLTGSIGVNFLEEFLQSKISGPFGNTNEEIVERAVDEMKDTALYDLYDTPDITLMTDWEDDDVLRYANTMALNISNNNVDGGRGEIDLLSDALSSVIPDAAYIEQINEIADAYKNMRDAAIETPVPTIVAKQHLDLINTYNALYQSISAMATAADDPALTLVRIKRYQDDALGLRLSFENMYLALEPYASLLGPDDPALLFVLFSSEFNS